jgi:hypothetical protein
MQTVVGVLVRRHAAPDEARHRADEVRPALELGELGAEVLAERTIAIGSAARELVERHRQRRAQPIEGEPGEVGLPSGELMQYVELAVMQRAAEDGVELDELRPGKGFEADGIDDVERRLLGVPDQHAGLGRDDESEVEPVPAA